MQHDSEMEQRIAVAFEAVGDALIHALAAATKDDWNVRHMASEEFGKAAVGVYRALCSQDGEHPA